MNSYLFFNDLREDDILVKDISPVSFDETFILSFNIDSASSMKSFDRLTSAFPTFDSLVYICDA